MTQETEQQQVGERGRRWRRRVGVGVAVTAVTLSIAAVSGALATFTDTAYSGQTIYQTSARAKPVDIRINTSAPPTTPCANTSDNPLQELSFPGTSLDEVNGGLTPVRYFCVENVGTLAANVLVHVKPGWSDSEWGCTGEEAAVDTTCGSGKGELASAVGVQLVNVPLQICNGNLPGGPIYTLPELAADAVPKFTLAKKGEPNSQRCIGYRLRRIGNEIDAQAAQSDRLAFTLEVVASDLLTPPPSVTVPPGPEG